MPDRAAAAPDRPSLPGILADADTTGGNCQPGGDGRRARRSDSTGSGECRQDFRYNPEVARTARGVRTSLDARGCRKGYRLLQELKVTKWVLANALEVT